MFALFPLGSETCTTVNVSTICPAGLLPLHFPALPSAHQNSRLIRRLPIWRMPTFCATPVCLLYPLFPSFRVQQLPCFGSLPACQVQGLNLALGFFFCEVYQSGSWTADRHAAFARPYSSGPWRYGMRPRAYPSDPGLRSHPMAFPSPGPSTLTFYLPCGRMAGYGGYWPSCNIQSDNRLLKWYYVSWSLKRACPSS